MTSLNTQLWELIKTHTMPEDAGGKSFKQQLMDENRISEDTAIVAIAEYRKFMYLCATRAERNVPSKAVDLVWHLHMQHSKDYWDTFCQKLGKPVHHKPGALGSEHLEDYKATTAAYRGLFGVPPKGIWKEARRGENILVMAGSVIPALMGVTVLNEGDRIFIGMFLLGVAILMFAQTAKALTEKGQLTLIFENEDPFADGDAGDCGSGDGGGCGD